MISAGDGADTMLGGGGADTYSIGGGDYPDRNLAPDAFGVVGDIINEIGGDIASTLGDSVNFTNIESIDNIFFDRTQIRYEEAESTLTITSNTDDGNGGIAKDVVHIFDHFNEDLPFRQVEQLLLDEGWGLDQIWNLVADGQGGVNRDVLIGGSGDDTLVSGGGVDVMQGGAGQDTFKLGSSDVEIADIDTAHGNVTMIRDFVSADDSIDLSALDIADVSILILVAVEEELSVKDLPEFQIYYTGVGKINASIKTLEIIRDYSPTQVINYGTAGSLNKKLKGLVEVTQFFQRDMDATPLGFKIGQTPFDEIEEINFGSAGYSCGTGDSFVTQTPKLKTDLVDMEAYAIAKICYLKDIKFKCFKYISDNADEGANNDWIKNVSIGKKLFIERMRNLVLD